MHLSPQSRATLIAAVILAGIPVLTVASPATAAPIKAGTCTIVGTADDDVLTGTDGDDVICGLGGDDKITGGGGDDVLRGGGGTDVVRGGPGDDTVAGGGGGDRVFGQAGDDRVRGDAGDDEVVGGPGDDRLGGYKGADELDGVDSAGAADVLRCGPGPDTAAADPGDQVKKNCETVVQNDPPTDIALVPATIPENEPIGTDIGDLTATDPDAGDSHTFTLVTGTGSADNALVRVDGDSLESNVRYDFEADSSFSVRVRATDDAGEFTEKAFTVTVTDANDAPVAVDDDATTDEDTSLVAPVSGPGSFAVNDTDQDGDSLAVTAATAVAGGTASVSAGMVTFAPNANLCGNDAGVFDYTVSDGHGGTDVGRVTVDITCVDDLANAVDDSRTVAEDSGGTVFNVLSNDNDPEGDPISVIAVTQPGNPSSSTSFTASGVTYTPGANYCNDPGAPADDTFTYTVTGGDSATVSVTVTCVNDAPVAVDDDRATFEDVPLDNPVTGAGSPAANDTDVDADTLTVTSVSNPAGGTVAIASGEITFTPTANLCGNNAGSYDYTVSDGNGGTDTGTVTVDLTCIDDAPVANDDSRTVGEDSGATTFGTLLGNDTDVEGDAITITGASDPADGATSFTAGDVTYTPDLNFCGEDSFTYTVNGGDTATVTVTVTCVNDAPTADDDSTTVAEDDPATAIPVLANDDDVESDPITIASASDPANGVVVLTGGTPGAHTGLTYQPDPDYCNDPGAPGDDTFTYTVNGGDLATVSVVVTCVDDDPTADDDSATVTLNDPATAVDVLANDDDVDGGPIGIASASDPVNGTVVLTGGTPGDHTGLTYEPDTGYCNTDPVAPADTFTYTLTPGGDSATVSVTVTCDVPPVAVDDTATVAEDDPATVIDVLGNDANPDGGPMVVTAVSDPAGGATSFTAADVSYTPDPDFCGPDSFTYTLNGGDQGSVDVTVTCVDDLPVANDDARTVAEDSGPTVFGTLLGNDTDVESDPVTITGASDPANGTTSFTAADVTYTPDLNYCNDPGAAPEDTFTYTVNGGDTATVSVTVTCVPDAPTLDNSAGTTTYTEDTAPVVVDGVVSISNPDGLAITAGSVTLTNDLPGDVLDWADNSLSDSIVEGSSTALQVNLTGTGTAAQWEAALEAVTFATPSQNPSGADRTATFSVTTTAGSPSDTKLVDAANLDDPPTADDDTATMLEDAAATAVLVLANDDDVDAGPMTIASATDPANGTVVLTGPVGARTGLTYQPDLNYCNDPHANPEDTFTYTLDGGSADPTATVSMTVTCVNDAPTAAADSYDAIGNTGLFVGTTRPATQAGKEITGSVLDNDSDVETPLASLVAEAVTDAPTTLGGTITIQSDGNFTYHPDDVDTGVTDTFTYRVCDTTPCTSGTDGNATGTLSLPIAGQVWYVRNNEPAGGDGTSDTPFDTLAEAEAASGTGDTVFVFDGSNTTSNLDTGYAMNANERLIGESQPLSLDPDGGGSLPTSPLHPGTSGAQPTLTALNEDVVVLASNTLVDGVDLDPAGTGGGISGGAGTDAVTVQNVNVTDTGTAGTQPGIEMDGTTGVNRFTGVTVTNGGSATAIGVRINNADRVLFTNTATNTIATTGAKALDAASTSLLTSRWNDITVTGSGTGAIRLSSTTGQPVLGDGSGTDLSLQTTSGATAALDVASSNTVTVDSAGTDTISATGGPAADIRNSNGSQYFFDSASSTNSAGDGVNLDTNLTSPVVINAGTIAGAAGIAFDINGGGVGGGGVVYDGAINDGAGQSVEVTGRDGGGITFSGNIADSGDAGGGIVIASNSQGSTSFSGASKVLNTGAGNAVVGAANGNPAAGHLISFTNGGLDIDTTSGTGFSATNGTVTVGGTGNSITTGTGTGLSVDTAGITVGNLNLDSISSNGAQSGIRLFTTGTTGRLIVTGTGGTCTFATPTCTGGNIANSTGDGISLISTASPTFSRVNVHDGAGNGMRATDVSALSVDNSIFVDNSDDIATNDEANLRMHNVTGSSSVTNSVFREARVNEVYWTPTTATATMAWTNNTVGPDNAGELGSGLLLNPTGTATTTLNVSGGSFAGNNGDSLRPAGSDQSATTVNVTGGTTFLDSNSGVNFSADDDADLTFNVTGATFTRHASHALQMIVNDNTTASSIVRGKALNNIIGNGTADSGSRDANGISYDLEGAADIVLNVSNNTIRNTDTQGIFIQSVRFPTGTPNVGPNVDLTLRDNTVTNIDDNSAFPFGFQHGTQVEARRNSSMCLDIAGNTSTGIGGAEHFRIRQRDASTFRLERLTGSATDPANIAAFIAGQNDAGSTASATVATTFTAVANGFCDDVP